MDGNLNALTERKNFGCYYKFVGGNDFSSVLRQLIEGIDDMHLNGISGPKLKLEDIYYTKRVGNIEIYLDWESTDSTTTGRGLRISASDPKDKERILLDWCNLALLVKAMCRKIKLKNPQLEVDSAEITWLTAKLTSARALIPSQLVKIKDMILDSPLLWNKERVFFMEMLSRELWKLKNDARKNREFKTAVECRRENILPVGCTGDWISLLSEEDQLKIQNVQTRKYDRSSTVDYIRFVRNSTSHEYSDMEETESRYRKLQPMMVMQLYDIAKDQFDIGMMIKESTGLL